MIERANQSRHVLVVGGARSGKSVFAEGLVLKSSLQPVYVATGQVFDAEMAERISKHWKRRDERWLTVEEPLELAEVLKEEALDGRAVLVDCLTLWLSNLMHNERDLLHEYHKLSTVLSTVEAPVVFVSNEVGQGIVPENALARAYRDEAGRLNQFIAGCCGRAFLVSCGLPYQLKPPLSPEIVL